MDFGVDMSPLLKLSFRPGIRIEKTTFGFLRHDSSDTFSRVKQGNCAKKFLLIEIYWHICTGGTKLRNSDGFPEYFYWQNQAEKFQTRRPIQPFGPG
jgi:hypothetical protein